MDENKTIRAIITEAVYLTIILGGILAYMHHDMQRMFTETHERMMAQQAEFYANNRSQIERSDRLTERSDNLYQIVIELLKERK